LKEDNPAWLQTEPQEKEDCLNFMLEILNIKISDPDEQDSINRQLILIADLIGRYYSKMTIPEIKEALRMYAFKKFTNIKVFRLIDCVSVGEILSAYIEFRNEVTQPFLIERQKLQIEQNNFTENDKKNIRENFLKTIFDDIVLAGFSSDAHHLFLDLEKSGRIKITVEEKKKMYKQQLNKYIPENKKEIRSKDPLLIKNLLDDFNKKIDSGKPLVFVSNRCRSIIVSDYFKKYTTDFETFKKEINEFNNYKP